MLLEIGKKDARYVLAKMTANCIDDTPTRYVINFVKVESNRIMATDTKRLFVADLDENHVKIPESGFYSVIKNNGTVLLDLVAEEPGIFPDVASVLDGERTKPVRINTKARTPGGCISQIVAFCAKRGPVLDCDFIRPLLAMKSAINVQFAIDDPSRHPVLFSGETSAGKWQYLVMPIMPADEETIE
jgi:hypothetical protein